MAISIGGSVGRGGSNALADVATVGSALVAVGIENGGVSSAPLSFDWLGDAIAHFQGVQGLMARPDGRIDAGGGTLRRINAILFPDEMGIRPLVDAAGLVATVASDFVWAPDKVSLQSDFVFRWVGVAGRGSVHYFQLDETVVPRWFGVLVPEGTTEWDRVHLFFHPTPAQARDDHDRQIYFDAEYRSFGRWRSLFHYLSDDMAVQFCASEPRRILVMPLFTQGASGDCGIFPQRWPEILGCILGRLRQGVESGATFQRVTNVVVSSFSSGITYSHHFRRRANLAGRLAGVIDFDGAFSTYRSLSHSLTEPAGRVVKVQQSAATAATVPSLAAKNIFPVAKPRWGSPWVGDFAPDAYRIHGLIPHHLMQVAAERAG
jgi:hypothetical protein